MKKLIPVLVVIIFILAGKLNFASAANSGTFNYHTVYSVCFTPGDNCTQLAVNTINQAKKTLLVQAYSFTSTPIAKALVDAKNRGVNVKVILDKSDFQARYTIFTFLNNHAISVWKDFKPAIAHNKVMVIDGDTVITGSFNFTKAAQFRNAENLLVIHSTELANSYTANWEKRLEASQLMNP